MKTFIRLILCLLTITLFSGFLCSEEKSEPKCKTNEDCPNITCECGEPKIKVEAQGCVEGICLELKNCSQICAETDTHEAQLCTENSTCPDVECDCNGLKLLIAGCVEGVCLSPKNCESECQTVGEGE